MTAPRIKSDFEALPRISKAFEENGDIVNATLRDLRQKTDTLRDGDWIGQGADVFYREMDDTIFPSLDRLGNALASAAQATDRICRIMHQAEDDCAALFRSPGGEGDEDSARHKSGDSSGVSTGAVVGGILGGLVGLVGGPVGAAAGAAAGAKLGSAIENAMADDPRVAPVQQKINSGDKQAAIDEAIKQYNIDTSAAKSIKYDPTVNGEGETDKDGNVRIGDAAFKSPAWLASTVGHEAVHAQQTQNGNWNDTAQGRNMNETEAYNWEVQNAEKNGLSPGETKTVQRRYDQHFNRLNADNQARAKAGNFTVP